MGFWGTELKPGETQVFKPKDEEGKLHLTRATLGEGSGEERSEVKVSARYRDPISVCSLFPNRKESCSLNLEFDDSDVSVQFYVTGNRSIRLTGYMEAYVHNDEEEDDEEDDSFHYDIVSVGTTFGDNYMGESAPRQEGPKRTCTTLDPKFPPMPPPSLWGSYGKYVASRDKCLPLGGPRPNFKFNGFGIHDRPGLAVKICSEDNPCPAIVTLYAKFGLHRYNLLNGTNLELIGVKSYNYTLVAGRAASDYYITLEAMDPATSASLTFQTKVDEHSHCDLIRTCYFARPLSDESKTNPKHGTGGFSMTAKLPEWPKRCPFQQFKVLKESQVQRNDWIRLCLELSIAVTTRVHSKDLSDLKILKVAIDTKQKGREATVYIHYKDPCKARVGKDVDRVAVVTRKYDDKTGCFSLVGQNLSSAGHQTSSAAATLIPEEKGSATLKEKGKNTSPKINRPRKSWLLLPSPRQRKAFKNKRRSICQSGSDDRSIVDYMC